MIKMAYIIRGDSSEPVQMFRERVLWDFVPRIIERDPLRLKITATAMDPPRFSIIPYRRERIALVSLWERKEDGAGFARWSRCMAEAWRGPGSGYLVEESEPVAYTRTWPDNTQTPGLGLLTLFRPRRGISDDDFIRMWHQGHTPLALRVHPLWNYIRNVVRKSVLHGSPALGGIVEEQCMSAADILRPARFFGGTRSMVPNMLRIALDIRKWMDLGSIENHLVHEYWIRDTDRTHARMRHPLMP